MITGRTVVGVGTLDGRLSAVSICISGMCARSLPVMVQAPNRIANDKRTGRVNARCWAERVNW